MSKTSNKNVSLVKGTNTKEFSFSFSFIKMVHILKVKQLKWDSQRPSRPDKIFLKNGIQVYRTETTECKGNCLF